MGKFPSDHKAKLVSYFCQSEGSVCRSSGVSGSQGGCEVCGDYHHLSVGTTDNEKQKNSVLT